MTFSEIRGLLVDTITIMNHYEAIVSLPNCSDCARKNCEYAPNWGSFPRYNCPLYEAIDLLEEGKHGNRHDLA